MRTWLLLALLLLGCDRRPSAPQPDDAAANGVASAPIVDAALESAVEDTLSKALSELEDAAPSYTGDAKLGAIETKPKSAEVIAALTAGRFRLRACSKHATAQVVARVSFAVVSGGDVVDVRVDPATIAADLRACIAEAMRKTPFEEPVASKIDVAFTATFTPRTP